MYAVKEKVTGLFLWMHHEYGPELVKNGFLAFTDKEAADNLLIDITVEWKVKDMVEIKGRQYPPDSFVVEEI